MHFLKFQFVPLLVTVVLHAVVVFAIFVSWDSSTPKQVVKRPNFVQARLVTLESQIKQEAKKSQKKPKIVDLTKKRKEQERKQRAAEQQRKKVAQQQKAAEQKKLLAKKAKEEARKKAEQVKKDQKLKQKQLERQAFDQAMRDEQMALAEQSLAVDAQSYMAAIAQRIEQNWSRPPSARNGMECELKIRLVPTGRVISVDVVRGSGNAQFDRSAEQAVKKVEQFPEIKQMKPEVFERYYRELTLVFKPQDLRQ